MPDDTVLLERHFDIAFAAPNGIQKLRELILTFAMQGKLVPQDPNDQHASELLKAISSEKQQLVKEGKIKQSKPSPEIKLEEVSHALPKKWEWVRLNDALDVRDGTHDTPKLGSPKDVRIGRTKLPKLNDDDSLTCLSCLSLNSYRQKWQNPQR